MIDLIIGGVVLLAVILAIRKIRKDRKNNSCCGGCSGCSKESSCHTYSSLEKELQNK